MVSADPAPQWDLQTVSEQVNEQLEDALDRGVSVDLLLTREMVASLSEDVGKRYRETLQQRSDFDVRTNDDVTGSFNIIDGVEVCIQVPNPLASSEAFGMIDLKDPEFAANVHKEFVPRWDKAEPLEF